MISLNSVNSCPVRFNHLNFSTMSSNAFARSRPRVRHQRVSKAQSYGHPRFLKLVKELVRIDEANKKLNESANDDDTDRNNLNLTSDEDNSVNNADKECSSSTNSTQQIIAQLNQSRHSHHHNHHHHHHHHHHNHPSRHQQQRQHVLQQTDIVCCPGLSSLEFERRLNAANVTNSYRSLEFSQSSSALHDDYYRQNDSNNADNQHQVAPQLHHQSYLNHHERHYNYPSSQQELFIPPNGGLHPSHPADYRSLSKCPSSSTSTNISLDCVKSVAAHCSNPLISNCEADPRQDENRSKRKRSANDTPLSAKKSSPTSSSPPSCSKRHKTSPELVRPLSPSFTKCPICLLDCMDRDPSFTNTCFHLFCFVCIENWSKSKATCPLCRTKFSKIIYNIRSESCFEEKVASPLRRDDDDDRFTYEQLSARSMIHNRISQDVDARLLFDNLRSNDVLMPHLIFTNQVDPRQMDLHSFNSMTSNANFSSTVPPAPFATTNYNPVGSNYIALVPSNSRLQSNPTGPAITSAYSTNTSLTNISSDTSNRMPRVSRSGRYIYSRNYDLATIDGSMRGSRSSGSGLNSSGITIDSRQHHHPIANSSQHHQHHSHHHSQQQQQQQQQHQHQQQQQQQQQHLQQRSTVSVAELGHTRQSQHQLIPLSYPIQPRHYTNQNVYARRSYTNSIDQHILDELYTQIPEM